MVFDTSVRMFSSWAYDAEDAKYELYSLRGKTVDAAPHYAFDGFFFQG